MSDIKIFKENEKLDDAFELVCEKLNFICKEYQLNYYELLGILECYKGEVYKSF